MDAHKEMGTDTVLKIEEWKLKDIKPYYLNAKTHEVGRIAASIAEFKVDQPIVVDGDGVIIKGHGRLKAAKRLKLKTFPVVVREDLTPEQVRLARLSDNRSAEAPWDTKLLEKELEDLNLPEIDLDVSALGIDSDWLEGLDITLDLGGLHPPNIPPVEEKSPVPEIPTIPNAKRGDVYLLGHHRVMCGDASDQKDITALLNGAIVDMLVTDPPTKPVEGVSDAEVQQLCVSAFKGIPLSKYNTVYCFAHGKRLRTVLDVFENMGWHFSQHLAWVHNHHSPGLDYSPRTELIFYGWKGKHKYYGSFSKDVLEFDHPGAPEDKPTDLLGSLIDNGSPEGGVVYDSFGGLGSSLIACEQTGRKALVMEISPAYVDVIVKRWEDLTGKTARLVSED